jgi:hypothetical protein
MEPHFKRLPTKAEMPIDDDVVVLVMTVYKLKSENKAENKEKCKFNSQKG